MPKMKPLTKVVPALTARTQFGQILRRVKQNKERFVVDRRGEPQAIIMSVEEYLRKFAKPTEAFEAIRRQAKARGLDRLTLGDINREIKAYRRERRRRATP
ncbi:MAG: type II toxin-antitoxin system Phd/YefM family antitoxin [Acidobacteria bacterium]|nr:type II toxin-antitoxin system Phd/YefM family antitoxin [Acidobacteriota bacterium]